MMVMDNETMIIYDHLVVLLWLVQEKMMSFRPAHSERLKLITGDGWLCWAPTGSCKSAKTSA